MSTGSGPVRGALFALAVVLLGDGVVTAENSVSRFRLRWLSDLGAESIATDLAVSGTASDYVLARVPGAAYVLSLNNGSAERRRRIAADYSMVYGLAWSAEGHVVVAADDGTVSLWSGLAGAERPSLRWRKDLGERAASVAWDGGDVVWAGTRRDRLIAISARDGETQWSADVGGRVEAPPLATGDSLFVATKDYSLLRLDASTGKERWSAELPGPANHPPVEAGQEPPLILTATWNGHLLAVHAETGDAIWTAPLESRLAGAPVASESSVAVATEDGTVRAFDLTGELKWSREGVGGERTDLLLHESADGPKRLIVVSTTLAVLDASTGEILDEYPAGAREDIERRFLDAMLEGERPYSESEKASILERESFPIQGRLFGQSHLFGNDLVFGTEEGWVYWFQADSVRPLCRYRAGRRAQRSPVRAAETLIAAATDAVFGLDPASGDTRWRRNVETVSQIASGETLAIVGEDRFDVLDTRTGARRWSLQGEYRAVAPVGGDAWLAFGTRGVIRVVDAAGTEMGARTVAHSIDAVTGLSEGSWALASREGTVSAVRREGSGLLQRPLWEAQVEVPVEALHASGMTLVVTGEDRLVGLSILDGSINWDMPRPEGEVRIVEDRLFVFGDDVLRLYDSDAGTISRELAVQSRAVGAALVDGAVIWLDVSGVAHRARLEDEEGVETFDLGEPLSRASFDDGGFLVTTDAGEVGLVELAPSETALSQPQ